MNFFKNFSPKKHVTNSDSRKSFVEISNDLGAFQYTEDGFTIKYEEFEKTLKWNEITELNVFKTDLMTVDRIDMEIVYGELCFTISEELPGWYQFVVKTKEIFPSIPKDWDSNIVLPPFATNYSTIYDRSKVVDL